MVTHVGDGDSIYVRPLDGGKPFSIRLHGVDAPEICQQGGAASRAALERRAKGRQVRVTGKARDSYGRWVAQVFLDGEDLGGWMVGQGQAWSYRFRGQVGPYALLQRQAQLVQRGLFAPNGLTPLYPGDFRNQHGPCRR